MKRVLIVDDQPANLYLLRALLHGHGFIVEEAPNGAEALADARRNPPDLIISDLLMPVLDGYSLLRHWRADHRLKALPFIVFTATYTAPRDERLAMALGADAFLIKPAEPEAIMACVEDILLRQAEGRLPSAAAPPQSERALLEEYNTILLDKLEKKILEAEQINRELRAEIMERKRAQEELRVREERFRATFEQAAVGIAHVGLDGRFLWMNDRLCTMSLYTRDELLEMTIRDITAPDHLAESDEARRSMLQGRTASYASEKRYLRKDGTAFWGNLVATLTHKPSGEPDHFISVIADITDRKQVEAELRLRDRAIQVVSQGILISDATQPDNPVIYASAGFERLTGYAPEEIIGRNCRFLQGADTDPQAITTLREAIAAGRSCAVEIRNHRKDGTAFWNALSLNPLHDEHGTLAYFVGVQNDVTQRRSLEEELRQAQKMEAIGQLAGGVAHDFNNHLTVIGGYSEQLLTLPHLPDSLREPIQAIAEAGEKAASLTRQLLSFSRQSILQPQVLDLNAVVAETAKLLRRLISESVLFSAVLGANISRVKVDPVQLDQVLMNLAVNARDAMPLGGRLTLETANVLLGEEYAATHLDCAPGPYVMLSMSDTGCGMTPEVQARIFEPFFTTKDVGKGTGLGLATVFGIVRQSNGCIHVYSEPGLGTTFKIYLPAVDEPAARAYEAPAEAAAAGGTETILLVEDDEGVRGLTLRALEMRGYKVLTAADGSQALRVLDTYPQTIDLILTDVVMPNISGPELIRQSRDRFPGMKALFMSGYTDDAVVRHGLLDASVAFIQKPYRPRMLAQKVREVLDFRT